MLSDTVVDDLGGPAPVILDKARQNGIIIYEDINEVDADKTPKKHPR
jgi:hypothetical protein